MNAEEALGKGLTKLSEDLLHMLVRVHLPVQPPEPGFRLRTRRRVGVDPVSQRQHERGLDGPLGEPSLQLLETGDGKSRLLREVGETLRRRVGKVGLDAGCREKEESAAG